MFLHIVICLVALVGLYLHIHLLRHHKVSKVNRDSEHTENSGSSTSIRGSHLLAPHFGRLTAS